MNNSGWMLLNYFTVKLGYILEYILFFVLTSRKFKYINENYRGKL